MVWYKEPSSGEDPVIGQLDELIDAVQEQRDTETLWMCDNGTTFARHTVYNGGNVERTYDTLPDMVTPYTASGQEVAGVCNGSFIASYYIGELVHNTASEEADIPVAGVLGSKHAVQNVTVTVNGQPFTDPSLIVNARIEDGKVVVRVTNNTGQTLTAINVVFHISLI